MWCAAAAASLRGSRDIVWANLDQHTNKKVGQQPSCCNGQSVQKYSRFFFLLLSCFLYRKKRKRERNPSNNKKKRWKKKKRNKRHWDSFALKLCSMYESNRFIIFNAAGSFFKSCFLLLCWSCPLRAFFKNKRILHLKDPVQGCKKPPLHHYYRCSSMLNLCCCWMGAIF